MWLTFRSGPDEGRVVEITGHRFVIGREADCSVQLPDDRVSRHHAEIVIGPDGAVHLTDLGSTNGTYVNGVLIEGAVRLLGSERIQMGDTFIDVSATEHAAAATEVGIVPPPLAGAAAEASPSTIERAKLRRSVRTAVIASGAAVAAAIVVVVLFVTGVFGGGGDDAPATTATVAELDIPAIIDNARASTGLVIVSRDGTPVGSGTGWVFDAEQGFIVTNQHVVNGGSEFAVRLADRDRPATVVASAPCDDLALLKVTDIEGLKSVTLGSQAELRQGETVVAVGFPGSASETPNLTATTGLVSVVRESFDLRAVDVPQYPNVIQTDAAINPGNSGGPLFDTRGRLVGVNSAGITLLGDRTIQGQGYAIGVDRVKEVIPSLAAGTSLGWTGMAFDYREGAPGLVVVDAVPDTPAALAGLGNEEVLVREVNGTPLDNSLPSYCDAVDGIDAGDSATFLVEQGDGTTTDLRVAFHGRPPSQ